MHTTIAGSIKITRKISSRSWTITAMPIQGTWYSEMLPDWILSKINKIMQQHHWQNFLLRWDSTYGPYKEDFIPILTITCHFWVLIYSYIIDHAHNTVFVDKIFLNVLVLWYLITWIITTIAVNNGEQPWLIKQNRLLRRMK